MTPTLPIVLPADTTIIEVTDPLPCAMLRFGQPCGNDASFVLVCPMPDMRRRLIPCCQMCTDDAAESTHRATGATWLDLLERALGWSAP